MKRCYAAFVMTVIMRGVWISKQSPLIGVFYYLKIGDIIKLIRLGRLTLNHKVIIWLN